MRLTPTVVSWTMLSAFAAEQIFLSTSSLRGLSEVSSCVICDWNVIYGLKFPMECCDVEKEPFKQQKKVA